MPWPTLPSHSSQLRTIFSYGVFFKVLVLWIVTWTITLLPWTILEEDYILTWGPVLKPV
jgi:hypothetical protein